VQQATEYFNKSPELIHEVSDLLQRADVGISNLDIRQIDLVDPTTGNPDRIPHPFVTHPAGDLPPFSMPLGLESSGTKRVFVLLMYLLESLHAGTPAVIDELESDLHPHMIPWILRLFTTPVLNPKNAQIFFTCHSADVMSRLDKTQIMLVEKDPDDSTSSAWRLDELQGVRRDDNFIGKYNAGAYGAVPEPV